jgi:hypothetical protein
LDGAQIRTLFQEMRGEAVPERMRVHVFVAKSPDWQ